MKKFWALLFVLWCATIPLAAHASNAVVTPPSAVSVTQVTTTRVSQDIRALGSLSASEQATISSVVAGRVSKIYFRNGQQVSQGMPIIQLDNSSDLAQYQSSLAALELSRDKYRRSLLLLNQAVSQQELETLKASLATDEANVKASLIAIDQKQIVAPFSGVLSSFNVNEGDYVSAGDPVVTLVNTAQLRVDYSVPQEKVPLLKQGQTVSVLVDAYPNQTFYGTVNFIAPIVNNISRMISVQAVVPNPQGLLAPGMFVHVAQQIDVTQNALVIPQQATQADISGYYVFVVNGNKVAKTYITVGEHVDTLVQVLSGLTAGQTIVTAGAQKLSDGSEIEVVSDATS